MAVTILDKVTVKLPTRPTVGGIFGDIDSGKTHLLCTAVELFDPERVLIIAADRNDPTLDKFKNIRVLDLFGIIGRATTKDPETVYEAFTEIADGLRRQGHKYDFVGFDSLSKIAHSMRIQTDAYLNSNEPRRVYNRIQNQFVPILWDLCNSAVQKNFHLWFSMWERTDFVEDITDLTNGGYTRYYPDFSPELGRLVRHEFSFLGRMTSVRGSISMGASSGKVNVRVNVNTELEFTGKTVSGKNRLGFPDKAKSPTVRSLLGTVGRLPSVESDSKGD